MDFNPAAIDSKKIHLDEILNHRREIERVVARHITEAFTIVDLQRTWEPGGGATLFRIQAADGAYFLKVKHRTVTVESRLESENGYSTKSSLRNEYEILQGLAVEYAPKVIFFDEWESFDFLALEWLDPFGEVVSRMSTTEILRVWETLVSDVRDLFTRGIVHTDIHEKNICFRGKRPILCDFEEARYLPQDTTFEKSLDFAGDNRYGNVGNMPEVEGVLPGLTCLARLRSVFEESVRSRLPEMIRRCNFDDSCPFNLDKLQEPDARVYQSIDLGDLRIEGQRSGRDPRLLIAAHILCKVGRKRDKVFHLDIGSNMGVFCFKAARYPFVAASVGLEAFEPYVSCAKALAFVLRLDNVRFHRFVCGEDDLSLVAEPSALVTMLSVYHHIANKDAFLDSLRLLTPEAVLAEFATQERYYPERGSWEKEVEHILSHLNYVYAHLLVFSSDYKRPIVLFTNQRLSVLDRVVPRLVNGGYSILGKVIVGVEEWITNGFAGRRRLK
jgi:predicted Ser/Thr protein kinase